CIPLLPLVTKAVFRLFLVRILGAHEAGYAAADRIRPSVGGVKPTFQDAAIFSALLSVQLQGRLRNRIDEQLEQRSMHGTPRADSARPFPVRRPSSVDTVATSGSIDRRGTPSETDPA